MTARVNPYGDACTANLLAWGREISADRAAPRANRIRACRTLIRHSADPHEQARARDLLMQLEATDE